MMGASILVFSRLPFVGGLPGDISFQRDGFSFFLPIVPIVTCVLLSLLLTLAVDVVIRLLR